MLMLDLNKSMDYVPESPERCGGEESATSNSSVVNADGGGDDDACSTRAARDAFAYNFDVMRVNSSWAGAEVENRGLTRCELVTRQLFPVNEMDRAVSSGLGNSNGDGGTGKCIELSFCRNGPAGPGGMRNVRQQQVKGRRGPKSKSSEFRGVTFYRRTGRWESHIWDCGKQVYLGGFDTAHAAARAYDKAAIKFRGVEADINFHISEYDEDMKQMTNLSKEEFVHIVRRQSNGFSRGSSKFRGVTLHKCGRWEARMGQFPGKKAYDKAAIKCNGRDAVTNFDSSSYEPELVSQSHSDGHDRLDLNLGISAVSPKNIESASEKRIDLRSSQEPQSTWKIHDEVNSIPMTRISTAASSRFSSRATTALFSAYASSSHVPYPPSFNISFTSFPTTPGYASQYYYHQIRPPPPPP